MRSRWEQEYRAVLQARKQAGEVTEIWYEPFAMTLADGVRYRPDFMVWRKDGVIEIHEVKGWSRNVRDGLTRLKWAAQRFPCYEWYLVRKVGRTWAQERLDPVS